MTTAQIVKKIGLFKQSALQRIAQINEMLDVVRFAHDRGEMSADAHIRIFAHLIEQRSHVLRNMMSERHELVVRLR